MSREENVVRLPQPLQVVKARLMVETELVYDRSLRELNVLQRAIEDLIYTTVQKELEGLRKELDKARETYVAAITKSCTKYPQLGPIALERLMPPIVLLKASDVSMKLALIEGDGRGEYRLPYNVKSIVSALEAHASQLPALHKLLPKLQEQLKVFKDASDVQHVTDEQILAYGGPLLPSTKGKELDVDKLVTAIKQGLARE